MASNKYFVKRDIGLFRKGNWTVALGPLTTGIYPQRDGAVAAAIAEAERTSFLGRASEVWVNDGHGFILERAFKASKPPDEDGKAGELDQSGEEDILFTVDDPATDATSY